MYKHLYECFKHWYRGGTIFIYSDPHFADEEMSNLRKNYIGDEEQVKRINSVVHKNDTLIVLGDVGNTSFVSRLNGYKVLIMGNHDKGSTTYKRGMVVVDSEVKETDNHLFDEVYEGPLMISDKILLSHEPVKFDYALNIHGHDHSGGYEKDDMHLNVCAELINYTPIMLKSIIETGKLKLVPNIHREIIDKASAKARKKIV